MEELRNEYNNNSNQMIQTNEITYAAYISLQELASNELDDNRVTR